jgi:hypothetical protein
MACYHLRQNLVVSSELTFPAVIFRNFQNLPGCAAFHCHCWLFTLTMHFSRNHSFPKYELLLEKSSITLETHTYSAHIITM